MDMVTQANQGCLDPWGQNGTCCNCTIPICGWGPAWYAQSLISIYAYQCYIQGICSLFSSVFNCMGCNSGCECGNCC